MIAALYHDAVYIQVDQGPPRSMRAEMDARARCRPMAAGACSSSAGEYECTADVLAVFGRRVGDVVTPTTGPERARVRARRVASSSRMRSIAHQRIAVAACIEQTIPFRSDPVTELRDRLVALGITGDELDETLRRAVRVGNRDVENFADNDPARFLDNTWKLLPESNPALHSPMVYTVRDYRIALQKMETLPRVAAGRARVPQRGATSRKPEIHARRVARTTGNLELAVRYLRAKLYSIALVEAIAELTGGDVPLDYFMGGVEDARVADAKRIESYLPQLAHGAAISIRRCSAARRGARVGVELRHQAVAARRVPARDRRRGRGDEGRRDARSGGGPARRRAVVSRGAAAEAGRRDRARGRRTSSRRGAIACSRSPSASSADADRGCVAASRVGSGAAAATTSIWPACIASRRTWSSGAVRRRSGGRDAAGVH